MTRAFSARAIGGLFATLAIIASTILALPTPSAARQPFVTPDGAVVQDVHPARGWSMTWYTFGGSMTADNPEYELYRGVGWSYPKQQDGAKQLVDRIISDCKASGSHRVVLHNLFGKTAPVGFMELDQFVACQEGIDAGTVQASWQFFLDDCTEEFSRLTEYMDALDPPGEVIWYFGTPESDPDFDESKVNAAQYCFRFMESMRPALDSGGSIAFDSATDAPEGSLWFQCMLEVRKRVEAYGGACYIEPRPRADAPWTHDWNWITVANAGWRHDPDLFPGDSGTWAASNVDLPGERLLFIRPDPSGKVYDDAGKVIEGATQQTWANVNDWAATEIARARRRGFTPSQPAGLRIGDPDMPKPVDPAKVQRLEAITKAIEGLAQYTTSLQSISWSFTPKQTEGVAAALQAVQPELAALQEELNR